MRKNKDDKYITTGGGITYDSRDAGKKAFGKADVEELRSRDYSEEQIKELGANVDRNQLGAGAQVALGLDSDVDYTDLDNYNPHAVGNRRAYDSEGNYDAEKAAASSKPDMKKIEVKQLMKEGGHSAQAINEMVKEKGYTLGDGAQKFLNKRLGAMTGQGPTEITATPDTPKSEVTKTLPTIDNDDFAAPPFQPGPAPDQSSRPTLSNYESAEVANNMMEDQYAKSKEMMTGQAAKASAAAAKTTGADDRIAGLDYMARMNPHIMSAKADMSFLNAFGDIYRPDFANRDQGGYDFQRAAAPELPDLDLEDMADKYLKQL